MAGGGVFACVCSLYFVFFPPPQGKRLYVEREVVVEDPKGHKRAIAVAEWMMQKSLGRVGKGKSG